jgi:hypothetical protein
MAANVLRSPKAVAMSVYVVRAFVRMREELLTSAVILKRLAEVDKKLVTHDVVLRDIYEKLRPLLTHEIALDAAVLCVGVADLELELVGEGGAQEWCGAFSCVGLVGRGGFGGRDDGRQRTEDGRQRTEDGGRRTEDGGLRAEPGFGDYPNVGGALCPDMGSAWCARRSRGIKPLHIRKRLLESRNPG